MGSPDDRALRKGGFNSIIYEEKDSYRGTKTRWCLERD